MAAMIEGAIQAVPLVTSILVGLTLFVVVMFFSFRSGVRHRSEPLPAARDDQPNTEESSHDDGDRLRLGTIILTLAIVAIVSTNGHRGVPAWDRWLLAIFFWGTLITLLVRTVQNKRRRNRAP